MKTRRTAAILLIAAFLCALLSCGRQAVPKGTYHAYLAGVEIFTYEFSDGSVTMHKAGVLQASGTFSLKGDELTLDFGTSAYVVRYDADADTIAVDTSDYGTLVMRK